CVLKPLTREEVEAYVTHRLWVARGSTSVTFTPKAFDLVHSISGGVPRMMNLVCDRALMVACEKQSSRIAEEDVVKAAGHLGQEIPKGKIKGEKPPATTTSSIAPPSRRTMIIGAAIVLVLAIAAAAIAFAGNPMDLLRAGPPPSAPAEPKPALPEIATPLPLMEMPASGLIPPPIPGSFVIVAGTYDNAVEAKRTEMALRPQVAGTVTIYTIDIMMAPEDVQRRILIGRFLTREEAEAALDKLGELSTTARVIASTQERLRVLP